MDEVIVALLTKILEELEHICSGVNGTPGASQEGIEGELS